MGVPGFAASAATVLIVLESTAPLSEVRRAPTIRRKSHGAPPERPCSSSGRTLSPRSIKGLFATLCSRAPHSTSLRRHTRGSLHAFAAGFELLYRTALFHSGAFDLAWTLS